MPTLSVQIFFWVLCTIFLLHAIIDFGALFRTLGWLGNSNSIRIPSETQFTIALIVPVLREQSAIEKTIECLLSLDAGDCQVRLIIVTTEREFSEKHLFKTQSESTPALVSRLAKSHNEKKHATLIEHIHYPDSSGLTVDQLNYAIGYLLDTHSGLPARLQGCDSPKPSRIFTRAAICQK